MIIIRNNIIPSKGFKTINLFGIWFVRKEANLTDKSYRHERIHTRQIWEMLGIFFYIWYFIEFLIRAFAVGGRVYKRVSFEREAYANDMNPEYLKERKLYSWIKYL